MSNTPSDAELDALRQADNGALNFVTLREFRTIARAVLAKWGSVQQEAQEPDAATFALWYADHIGDDNKPVRDAAWETYQAFAGRTSPKKAPAPLSDALGPLKVWWAMHEAQWELCDKTPADDAVILHFMVSGAYTVVTAGQMRAALASQKGTK